MAPALSDNLPPPQIPSSKKSVPKSIFPDGIKTSGQHPPLYHQLRSYDEFPDRISGPTVWDADDYRNNPERWTHHLAEEEIVELGKAADDFRFAGIPLTGIAKVGCLASGRGGALLIFLSVLGQLSTAYPLDLARVHSQRTSQWQGIHSFQGFSGRKMGQSQICHCVHGSGDIPRVLCQPERKRPCTGARQGLGRRCQAD